LGDYNVAFDRLAGKLAAVLSGIRISTDAGATEKTVQKPPSAEPRPIFHETRLALVIGNSNYANLPKLSNPTNDARSIAEVLQKLGYTTPMEAAELSKVVDSYARVLQSVEFEERISRLEKAVEAR